MQIVFGNEDALVDSLLYDCSVPTQLPTKPILTGRWGSGKTAALFLRNKEQSEIIASNTDLPKYVWYMKEDKLDIRALYSLRQKHKNDPRMLIGIFEEIWAAEILRTMCVLLRGLHKYYGVPSGKHWESILKVGGSEVVSGSIWKQIPEVARIIFGDSGRADGVFTVHGFLERLFQEKTYHDIQRCLADIRKMFFLPVIAIEPIDSPASVLEDHPGLAQPLLTALLNVYRDKFQPSSDQLIEVNVSVPWHRVEALELDAPQKMPQYVDYMGWTRPTLKEFVNRRINWEFARLRRHHRTEELWPMLFDNHVKYEQNKSQTVEESFDYLLRHTHHRPRHIQRLARIAVEKAAKARGMSLDDVLEGKGGTIDQEDLRETVYDATKTMAQEVINEGGRRFDNLRRLTDEMKGMNVPIKSSDLNKRVIKVCPFNTALDALWEAGIIGLSIATYSPQVASSLKAELGQAAYRFYRIGNKTAHVWHLFVYSWDGDYGIAVDRFGKQDSVQSSYVLHPIMFRHLVAHVKSDWPIGA